jgi:hypothetical protein
MQQQQRLPSAANFIHWTDVSCLTRHRGYCPHLWPALACLQRDSTAEGPAHDGQASDHPVVRPQVVNGASHVRQALAEAVGVPVIQAQRSDARFSEARGKRRVAVGGPKHASAGACNQDGAARLGATQSGSFRAASLMKIPRHRITSARQNTNGTTCKQIPEESATKLLN